MTSPPGKFFFWCMALALIMACVPSAVTPVPPLDPNAINTMIIQTSDSALTQTLEAVPFTPTQAPTLRSTFTPEPTYTFVPAIIFPTVTPVQRLQYFRVKHDNQLAVYDFKSRTAAKDWHGIDNLTPETVPLFVGPRNGVGTNRTIVDGNWEIYIDALNNNDEKKLRYLKLDNSGLFNSAGFPKLESLTMGGNIIAISELQGDWARVNTINYENPGILKDVNYMTRPDLVHKFVVVAWKNDTQTTYWINPPQGPTYWPLVSSREVWIPLERIEPFPTLPRIVTANTTQEIRRSPSKEGAGTGVELAAGEFIRIVDYFPSGPNVWGRTVNGRWIALLLDRKYLTDWKMDTLPPP